MSYSIYVTQTFKKEFKKLAKKHPSLKSDLENLSNELLSKPTAGVNLGKDFYKVRMAISSKGKGKSAGAEYIDGMLFTTGGAVRDVRSSDTMPNVNSELWKFERNKYATPND